MKNNWHNLIQRYVAGSTTESETLALEQALKEDAELRALYLDYINLDTALEAAAAAATEMTTISQTSAVRTPSRRNAWLQWRPLTAAAAGLAFGLLAWAMSPKSAPDFDTSGYADSSARDEATTSSLAVLSRGVNMEWDRTMTVPTVNGPLQPGLLRLKSGVAEIEFFQGARLCIEGPAEIQLVSAGEAFCRYGRFSAHVPPQARGFRIGTPKGDIVDLGTDFGLDLNDAASELHVFKGEVEFYQPKAQMRTLTTGNAMGLEQSNTKQTLVANPSAFAFSGDLSARVNESQRFAFENWQKAAAQWNNNADLLLRLDFQDSAGARSLRNTAAHGQHIAAASIVGCTWADGRWPGKQALQFRSVSDRVRFNVPGEYKQLTLATWVQLHSLSTRQSQSSICMSQGIEVGGIHWQVLHNGSLCLGVIASARPDITDDYISPVVFTPERFGQWVHLAVTFDNAGKEVRHYVNGDLLSRHPLKRPLPLRPALAELGNWLPSTNYRAGHPVRNFVGCMDDFSLCTRALSDDEVRTLAK